MELPIVKANLDKLRSLCAVGTASLFALFLAVSQPHRVHHLLENFPAVEYRHLASADQRHRSHSHDHTGPSTPLHAHKDQPDAQHDGQTQTNCVTQSVAKHSHLDSIPATNIVHVERVCFDQRRPVTLTLIDSGHSPIVPRAPPPA
jgi:hypothetical protein